MAQTGESERQLHARGQRHARRHGRHLFLGGGLDLAQGAWLDQPAAVSIGKKDGAAAQQKDSPYRRLLAALERLTKLIQSGTGRSNRELKSVTRQLDSICDEWEND